MNSMKGFTFVELLIVVTIIAIVAAAVIPFLEGQPLRNSLMVNGFICDHGLEWSVSQGYRQQVIGIDGLPRACNY